MKSLPGKLAPPAGRPQQEQYRSCLLRFHSYGITGNIFEMEVAAALQVA
jgi:hypothetical protein